MNKKYQLLTNDFIDIRHPHQKTKIVRLYRIISLRKINNVDPYNVGGYIQSEANLDINDDSWVYNTAKIFDNGYLTDDSSLRNSAAIYGEATVKHSVVEDYAHVYGDSIVQDSKVSDKVDVRGGKVNDSILLNASVVFENPVIVNCTMKGGSMIHGNARVERSTISDVSTVKGDAFVIDCNYSGRTIISDGEHKNETLDTDIQLNIQSGKGEPLR